MLLKYQLLIPMSVKSIQLCVSHTCYPREYSKVDEREDTGDGEGDGHDDRDGVRDGDGGGGGVEEEAGRERRGVVVGVHVERVLQSGILRRRKGVAAVIIL